MTLHAFLERVTTARYEVLQREHWAGQREHWAGRA
jgi:hypothetical protein